MWIETIIIVYAGTCVSLLAFNCLYIFFDQRQKNGTGLEKKSLEEKIKRQLKRLFNGLEVENRHHLYLVRQLTNSKRLEYFHHSLSKLETKYREGLPLYLEEIKKDFVQAAKAYQKESGLEAAYFAYVTARWEIGGGEDHRLLDYMISFVKSDSVYCRENALKVIYGSGSVESVELAFDLMNNRKIRHHTKLLVKGLMSFSGDKELLAKRLWNHEREYDTAIKLSVMKFIRFQRTDFDSEFYRILTDEKEDRELRFEAIRYFQTHYYKPAGEELVNFLRHGTGPEWEYAAIAAKALNNYPGKASKSVLMLALTSPNWYVRYNAGHTLIHCWQLSDGELSGVYSGSDQYAKEILEYMTAQKRHQSDGKAAGNGNS